MIIYYYSPMNGRYLGSGIADPDPLDEQQWIIPAYATADAPPLAGSGQYAAFVDEAWVLLDEPLPDPEPEPAPETPEQTRHRLSGAIQQHLDNTAQSLDYDSIFTAVTYADEPAVAKFQIEGSALRVWRSLVWQHGYAVLAQVLSGSRPIPTEAELIAELPVFTAPVI